MASNWPWDSPPIVVALEHPCIQSQRVHLAISFTDRLKSSSGLDVAIIDILHEGYSACSPFCPCPIVPAHCEQSYHLRYLVQPSVETRQAFITFQRVRRILSVFHYVLLRLSPVDHRMAGRKGNCPVTEEKSERRMRLPFFNQLG